MGCLYGYINLVFDVERFLFRGLGCRVVICIVLMGIVYICRIMEFYNLILSV